MIQAHYKKANIAAGVWLVSMIALIASLTNVEGNIWDEGNVMAISIFLIYAVSLILALWYYAKAKGYWGIFGAILFFFSFFGLLLILILPDRRKDESNNET